MDLKEYMAIKRRMVKMQKGGKCAPPCEACPLEYMNNGVGLACYQLETMRPEKAIEIVKQWAKEHPAKTYAQDFFEKLPNARKDNNGIPTACRKFVYGTKCENIGNCAVCWNEPMEEGPTHD